jgi:hypothetical protein
VLGEKWPVSEVTNNLDTELFGGLPIGNFQIDADVEAAIVAFFKTLMDGFAPSQE